MRYKTFGRRTGLRVSQYALGTGNFGTRWGAGARPGEARTMFEAFAEAGGNFIDTADNYQFGESEELVGPHPYNGFTGQVSIIMLNAPRVSRRLHLLGPACGSGWSRV